MAAGTSRRHINLLPVIRTLLDKFPFRIRGFHVDNGSEYINHPMVRVRKKLRIEFTKPRSRHSNDNGLTKIHSWKTLPINNRTRETD